jgi:MSHA biogenesis protein MshJ
VTDLWRKLAAWFDGLQMRERVLVLVAALVATVMAFDLFALQPLAASEKRLAQALAEARQNLAAADSQVRTLKAAVDPLATRRAYRDALRKQLAEIDQNMQGFQRGLVPPERMAKLLEEMLARVRGLQLVSLRTLPVQRFEDPRAHPPRPDEKTGTPGREGPARAVYQHGFELTLQGSYADLHEYLSRLEKVEWQMFWRRIGVSAEQHPKLNAVLTVQTLSLDKAWLIL